ncbi:hypothetical protein ACQ4WX_44880 [Streptomyces lasalocidi]
MTASSPPCVTSHHPIVFASPHLPAPAARTGPTTQPTHAGDRPSLRTFFSAPAAIGALSALVVCAAVAAAPDSVRTPLAWAAGTAAAVLSAAVATAAHGLGTTRGLRHRLEAATRDPGRLLHQQARTSEETRQEQQRLIDEPAQQRAEFTGTFEAERGRGWSGRAGDGPAAG